MNKISLDRFINKMVIKINDMYPILIFDGEEFLTIECPWRLIKNNKIIMGSGEYNPHETYQKAKNILSNMLLGQKIKHIRITPGISDLNIEFSNGITLELFNNKSIYESWTLSDSDGLILGGI